MRRISPRMVRVTLGGPALADFSYEAPDQQVKLYFPRPGQSAPRLPEPGADGDIMRWYGELQAIPEDERPWTRSYTIRAHDAARGTVDVDFVLHGGAGGEGDSGDGDGGGEGTEGPATRWARSAGPGDVLGMFGPSAYFAEPVPLGTTDWMLLAGDESALPAIGTIIEALPTGARAVAYVEVRDASEEQRFESAGEVTVHWLHRAASAGNGSAGEGSAREGAAGEGGALVAAVRAAAFPAGSMYAWLGGEAGAVRALRRHLVGERGLDKRSIHFTGYWRRRLTHDDAPTEADLAEARERLADRGPS